MSRTLKINQTQKIEMRYQHKKWKVKRKKTLKGKLTDQLQQG